MKKTVFISSTFEDLKLHRAKVWEVLEEFDVNIRGMEQFGARKDEPLSTCLAEVEQSDIYVGIIALKLGSIDKKSGKSITQLEYEKAVDLGKDILIYLIDEKNTRVSPSLIDFGEKHNRLVAFKSILKENHTVDSFVDESDLAEKLKRRFGDALSKKKPTDEKENEYENSEDILNKFCLMPMKFSGREIKIEVRLMGDPFPVSKSICKIFGFEYGKTIGIHIDIIKPKLKEKYLENLFIDYRLVDEFLKFSYKDKVEILAKVLFSDSPINTVSASFLTRTYSTLDYDPMEEFTTTIPAEGTMILVLTKVLDKIEN